MSVIIKLLPTVIASTLGSGATFPVTLGGEKITAAGITFNDFEYMSFPANERSILQEALTLGFVSVTSDAVAVTDLEEVEKIASLPGTETVLSTIIGDRIFNTASLAIGSTATNVAHGAVNYIISGIGYTLAANAVGVGLNVETVAQNQYGAWALDVTAEGEVSVTSASDNTTGYASAALAIAAVPAVASSYVRLGYVTAMCTAAAGFIAGTTLLSHGTVTDTYTDSPVYISPAELVLSKVITNTILDAPSLGIGSTATNVAHDEINYVIGGQGYTLGENAIGVALTAQTVPQNLYGAWALDVGANGTVDIVPATLNTTGYANAILAVAGLPAVASDHVRLGYVDVISTNVAGFIAGTTALSHADATDTYTDSAVPTSLIVANADIDGVETILSEVITDTIFDSPALAIGSTTTNVAHGAVDFTISGKGYTLPANAVGVALTVQTVPQSTYGAWALDVGSNLTVDIVPATLNTTGYASDVLAILGLPAVGANHVRLGYVTAISSNVSGFVAGTTALSHGDVTDTYTNSSVPTSLLVANADIDAAEMVLDKITNDMLLDEAILAIGSTATNIAHGAVSFVISGKGYSIAANVAGLALAAVTVPQNMYGAWALDAGIDGTVDVTPADDNVTGYATANNAAADIPAVAANHIRLGYATVMSTNVAGFIAGTTALSHADATDTYENFVAYDTGLLSLALLGEDDAVANKVEIFMAFQYMIQGVTYQKAAANSIAPAGDVTLQNVFGAYRVLIDAAGTVSFQNAPPAASTKQEYGSAALALAALAKIAPTVNTCPIATFVIQANAGADFTCDASDLGACQSAVFKDGPFLSEKLV